MLMRMTYSLKTDEPQIVVPDDYPTIQEAVIAAVNGDTIMVKPGEYIENITIKSKNITLCSQDPYDEDIVSNTIISGGGNGPVITINSGESIIAVHHKRGQALNICILRGKHI